MEFHYSIEYKLHQIWWMGDIEASLNSKNHATFGMELKVNLVSIFQLVPSITQYKFAIYNSYILYKLYI